MTRLSKRAMTYREALQKVARDVTTDRLEALAVKWEDSVARDVVVAELVARQTYVVPRRVTP